jgi:uncharacterized protein (DUF1697 family)
MKETKTYIALIRGVNVSGKNMMKMPALVKTFESVGLKDVSTYLQSGNVLFKTEETDPVVFQEQIYNQISKDFGFSVPVMIIEPEYISKVRDNNPFLKREDIDLTKLYVTFLSKKPDESDLAKIDAGLYAPEEYMVTEKVIYLYYPAGAGHSKLHNNFFEKKLKVTATTRNWNTVNTLVELSKA